jgi:hypothetical protein
LKNISLGVAELLTSGFTVNKKMDMKSAIKNDRYLPFIIHLVLEKKGIDQLLFLEYWGRGRDADQGKENGVVLISTTRSLRMLWAFEGLRSKLEFGACFGEKSIGKPGD